MEAVKLARASARPLALDGQARLGKRRCADDKRRLPNINFAESAHCSPPFPLVRGGR
jgi:hypothetical protein